jgi:dTMP kinase
MFVVFEGIDGSGKTTLSDRVAALLDGAGVTAHHARPKGELKSELATDIRTMTRNPRSLQMSPHTELLLYLARDSQMIDTVIRPALDKADVVIADRYVYSPVVLTRARGQVPEDDIEKATQVVARGLWPDLVVYCDVDIHTSELRKRMDKIINPREADDFGRKGLAGLGLRDAMRGEYLRMAKADPGRWMVVDNVNRTIAENSARIARKILEVLGRGAAIAEPPPSIPARLEPGEIVAGRAGELRRAFYDHLGRLADAGATRAAAFHGRSLFSQEAWALRERLLDAEPELVAYGLEPLDDDRAKAMRERLAERAPRQVAKSLGARWADADPWAWGLRLRLVDAAPVEVVSTTGSLDTEPAWELRDRLAEDKDLQAPVLATLKRIDTDRAWKMRDRLGKSRNDWGLLEGLAGIDSERAWALRRKHQRKALPWVLVSTAELVSDAAWALRDGLFKVAPKLVLQTMYGMDHERAWAMRRDAGFNCKEALTSIKGLDCEEAWRLRAALAARWPAHVAKSIGLTLAPAERGRALLYALARDNPYDPEVLHYLVKLLDFERAEAEAGAHREEV